MARAVRFGRLPAKAPDLTATIMAMIAQYEGQRDANILRAWNTPGAEFEGKPVTDDILLDHFDQRIKETEEGDPMRDYWEETKDQYQFAIAEDKMETKYDLGQIKEGAMAAFYRHWAGKVPRQSAAWRSLMQSAGRFEKATRGRSNGSSAAAHAKAVQARLNNIYEQQILPGQRAWSYILNAAAGVGIGAETDAGMGMFNASQMDDVLNTTASSDPEMYDQLQRAMAIAFPGRSAKAPLTGPDIERLLGKTLDGLRTTRKIERREGLSTTSTDNSIEQIKAVKNNVRSINRDIADDYQEAHEELAKDLEAADGDPIAEAKAFESAAQKIERLVDREPDLTRSGKLFAETRALRGERPPSKNTAGADWSGAPSAAEGETVNPEDLVDEKGRPIDTAGVLSSMEAIAAEAFESHTNAKGMADGSIARVWDIESESYVFMPTDQLPPNAIKRRVKSPGGMVNGEKVPAGWIIQAAVPREMVATVGNVDRSGSLVDPSSSTATGALAHQLDWGEGDTSYMVNKFLPNGEPRQVFTDENPLQSADSSGNPPKGKYDPATGQINFTYSADKAESLGATLLTPGADGEDVFNSNLLVKGDNVNVYDIIAKQQVSLRGGIAAERLVEEPGEPSEVGGEVKRVVKVGGEAVVDRPKEGSGFTAEGVPTSDPHSFLAGKDQVVGSDGGIIKRGQGQSDAVFFQKIMESGRVRAYNQQKLKGEDAEMWARQYVNDAFQKAGLTPPKPIELLGTKGWRKQKGATGGYDEDTGEFEDPVTGVKTGGGGVTTGLDTQIKDEQGNVIGNEIVGAEGYQPGLMQQGERFGTSAAFTAFQPGDLTFSDIHRVSTWASATLEKAGSSKKHAEQFAGSDINAAFKADAEDDPTLLSDPYLQDMWFQGADLLRINGGAKGSEELFQQGKIAGMPDMAGNGFFPTVLRNAGERAFRSALVSSLPSESQIAIGGGLGADAKKKAEIQLEARLRQEEARRAGTASMKQAAYDLQHPGTRTGGETPFDVAKPGELTPDQIRERDERAKDKLGALGALGPGAGLADYTKGIVHIPGGVKAGVTPKTGLQGRGPDVVRGGIKPKPIPRPDKPVNEKPPPEIKVPEVRTPTTKNPGRQQANIPANIARQGGGKPGQLGGGY